MSLLLSRIPITPPLLLLRFPSYEQLLMLFCCLTAWVCAVVSICDDTSHAGRFVGGALTVKLSCSGSPSRYAAVERGTLN